jgi:multidrug efflux pump subunit AcrA (membrane-fusion protein)
MSSVLKISLLMMLLINLLACGSQEQQKKSDTHQEFTVRAQDVHKLLHFSGTIQPIQEHSIVSPMEAVVATMNFHYGQMVKKEDVVLTLTSTELQKQYNETLTDYLKAKDNYSMTKAKFIGTEELWEAGLLSKNNYLSEKSGVDTARIALMQASRKLTELLDKMDEHDTAVQLAHLSLADFDKIQKILTASHNLIRLKATGNGVMLHPPQSGEDKTTRITVGSSVKSGQVIALVGDLSGISVEIDVPEVDIEKITPGMKATITGIAFGGHQIEGTLVTINAQASSANSGGLPSFTAVIQVTNLTSEQQQWLKVGMSAAIELNVNSKKQLLIPIAAIHREHGVSMVRVKNGQGGIESTVVTTGPVQADTVVIETGLNEGAVVVYD